MTTPNTALQVVPAEPLAPAPAAPVAEVDARTLMESIIADFASSLAPTTEPTSAPTAPLAPVSPVQTQPADLQYQMPGFVSEDYNAIEAWLVNAMQDDQQGAYDLGTAVFKLMPQLIVHNRDYVLWALGLSPEQAYQQVEARDRAEYAVTATLASETDKLFGEYVAKGVAAGLDPLQAAGLAAVVYQEFSRGYWQQGNAWQSAYDKWRHEIRSGYKLGPARDAFRKAFDDAFRRVAQNYKHTTPLRVASARASLTGGDLMEDILRERGITG